MFILIFLFFTNHRKCLHWTKFIICHQYKVLNKSNKMNTGEAIPNSPEKLPQIVFI